jgi:IS30 family transposase
VVSRGINRNGGRGGYRAHEAQRRAEELTARSKAHKLVAPRRLHGEANAGLAKDWSPQNSARLEVDHPDDPELRVSHETIYRARRTCSRPRCM